MYLDGNSKLGFPKGWTYLKIFLSEQIFEEATQLLSINYKFQDDFSASLIITRVVMAY